jgi:transcription-repair coupling factor (superfamily II helicase)
VIHAAHGVGRFNRLVALDGGGKPLLQIAYRDGKLMLPVEDLGLLYRLGGSPVARRLDRLGSTAWSNRRNRAGQN